MDKLEDEYLQPLIFVVFLLGMLAGGLIFKFVVDQNDPVNAQSLVKEVSDAPKTGIVLSSSESEICLTLLGDGGDADTVKSCVEKQEVFNLDEPAYGQPAVSIGVGNVYEVHYVEDSGSKGLLFVPWPTGE